MKPKIVNLKEFFVVGIGLGCQTSDISNIEGLWDKFLPRVAEIKGSKGVCGVCSYLNVDGDCYYIVGCHVGEHVDVPEGMEVWRVIAHRYLVSSFCGEPKKMGKKWQSAVMRLLPKAGVETRPDGPWLEFYQDNCYSPRNFKVTCDLYTPVEG